MKGDFYTITVTKRDTSKTYEKVKDFDLQGNTLWLDVEVNDGYLTSYIIPLFNVEDIEIGRNGEK